MIISDTISRVRDELNDSVSPYRYTYATLMQYALDGVRDIMRRRPDARFDENSDLWTLPEDDLYDFNLTGGHDGYASEYDGITGWDTLTYPILYMKGKAAASETPVDTIEFYYSDASRTTGTTPVAKVVDCLGEKGFRKVVQAQNSSTLGGSIRVDSSIAKDEKWEVEAVERDIPLDEIFTEPLVAYMVSRAFGRDAHDSINLNRASAEMQKYITMLEG